MSVLLADEEISKRWLEGYKEQDLTSDDYNLDNLRDNLYFEDMYALRAIAKAQLKKVFEAIDKVYDEPDKNLRLALGYLHKALSEEVRE